MDCASTRPELQVLCAGPNLSFVLFHLGFRSVEENLLVWVHIGTACCHCVGRRKSAEKKHGVIRQVPIVQISLYDIL